MEQFIQLILIISIAKYCLKAALTGSLRHITLYSLIAGLIAVCIYPIVISQSMNIIDNFLSNKKIVCDASVIISLEAISGIFISLTLLDNYFKPKDKRSKLMALIKILPGVICFVGIAYFELLFFKTLVGVSFEITASIYAIIISIAIFLFSIFLKYLLNGESAKLEFKIILNILILILGLLMYSSVADYNLSNAQTTIDWKALVTISGIVMFCLLLGLLLYKINFKQLIKKQRWIK